MTKLAEAQDLDELYVQILSDKLGETPDSGMGLLILTKDYDLKIGARFQKNEETGECRVIIQTYYFIEQ